MIDALPAVAVSRAEIVPFRLPLRAPLATGREIIGERRGFVVVLRDGAGREGFGEAIRHPFDPPQVEDERLLRDVAARLAVDGVSAIPDDVAGWIRVGLEMALLDLHGRAVGRPAFACLGAEPRPRVPMSGFLEGESTERLLERASDLVSRGFRRAKLKRPKPTAVLLERVRALREAHPELALRIDANGSWSLSEARQACAELAALGVDWIEQPLDPADRAGAAALRRNTGVRVAADEAVVGPDSVRALAAAEAADVIVIKLSQVGGVRRAFDTAVAAQQAGLAVAVTDSIESGLARTAAMHVAAALPGRLEPCGFDTARLLAGDFVRGQPEPAATIRLGDVPGLGLELDRAALAGFAPPTSGDRT